MEFPLDPAVIGVIGVIVGGSILAIVAVIMCCVCNKCCRDGKHQCSIYYQPDNDLQNVMVVANRTEVIKNKISVPILKDSVLTGEGPPTYQMATEYPRVYAGQYYIGMSGESEVTPMSNVQDNHLHSRQPPDYHLVVPY